MHTFPLEANVPYLSWLEVLGMLACWSVQKTRMTGKLRGVFLLKDSGVEKIRKNLSH